MITITCSGGKLSSLKIQLTLPVKKVFSVFLFPNSNLIKLKHPLMLNGHVPSYNIINLWHRRLHYITERVHKF